MGNKMIHTYIITSVMIVILGGVYVSYVRYFKAGSLPSTLSAMTAVLGIIYSSVLIPGIVNLMHVWIVYALCAIVSLSSMYLLRRYQSAALPDTPSVNNIISAYDLLIIAVLLSPFLSSLRTGIIEHIANPALPLSYDVRFYHLPSVIDYWQEHSLWVLRGLYSSYSYAYELLAVFMSIPYGQHWGVVIFHYTVVAYLVIALSSLIKILYKDLPGSSAVWIYVVALTIYSMHLIVPISFQQIGKNDLFQGACIAGSMAYLLLIVEQDAHTSAVRSRNLWLLLALSYGLALGTKPTAILYGPIYAVIIILAQRRKSDVSHTGAKGVLLAAVSIVTIFGGFWLLRNLVAYGSLSPVELGWQKTIYANFDNPRLWEFERQVAKLIAISLAPLPYYIIRKLSGHRNTDIRHDRILLIIHLASMAAFIITPHVVFTSGPNKAGWNLRLNMPMVIIAGVYYSAFLVKMHHVISSQLSPRRIAVFALLLGLFLTYGIHRIWGHKNMSYSGDEKPCSAVYTFIQNRYTDRIIYTVGLFPYDLYGKSWSNKVLSGGSIDSLYPPVVGVDRIARAVRSHVPDVIAIGVDPLYSLSINKPETVIAWMERQNHLFQKVYSDEYSDVFILSESIKDSIRENNAPMRLNP